MMISSLNIAICAYGPPKLKTPIFRKVELSSENVGLTITKKYPIEIDKVIFWYKNIRLFQ